MFQDIAPHRYSPEFCPRPPRPGDFVLAFWEDEALVCPHNNGCENAADGEKKGLSLPGYEAFCASYPEAATGLTYLLSVDDAAIFLCEQRLCPTSGHRYVSPQVFRKFEPAWLAFAGATAAHLAHWYSRRRFCGRCGEPTRPKADERALTCPACALVNYPRISPVVIVGICDGERLLMARAANGVYKRWALVAGYVEIGETLEDAVRREVAEEVGLQVKNLRYFKSQPWAFSGSLLAGFFADLDGPDKVSLDTRELAEALWFQRDQIPDNPAAKASQAAEFSLTWTMVETFRRGEEPR